MDKTTNRATPLLGSVFDCECVPAYRCERFPTGRRATGVGFGHSSGALPERGSAFTSVIILTIGSVLTFVSPSDSPQTNDLHLDQVECMVGERGTAELDFED